MNLSLTPATTAFRSLHIVKGNNHDVDLYDQIHEVCWSDQKNTKQVITTSSDERNGVTTIIYATNEDVKPFEGWREKYGSIAQRGNWDTDSIRKQMKEFTLTPVREHNLDIMSVPLATKWGSFDPIKWTWR